MKVSTLPFFFYFGFAFLIAQGWASYSVSYLFVFLGSFFKSLMDATENENFFESIFRGKNQNFWYKRVSWAKAKRIFSYKIDVWHLSQSAWVLCWLCAMKTHVNLWGWFDIVAHGLFYNFGFWLFYHKIFKIK
jgi:hypothetical protein